MIRTAALSAMLLFWAPAFAADSPTAPAVQVQTVPPRQQVLKSTVDGYGSVTSSEEAIFGISFLHAGQIAQLLVRSGESVNANQKLVVLTADPAVLLGYQRAAATLGFAERDLARTRGLVAQHLATNAQLAVAQKAVDDATTALEAERKLGNDRRSETAVAPFDGYVAAIAVAPGDRVQPNTTILKLARTDNLRVTVGLQPEDAARIRIGMKAEVVPVFAPDHPLEGSVQGLGGTINPVTRLVDAWIALPPTGNLISGSAVEVRIVLEEHTGWVVPRPAVLRDAKSDYVFQVTGTTAHRIPVRTGVQTDALTEVVGAIGPQQNIVTLGNYELQDGMTVRESAPQ
jgi:membrane fusion protein (multidrug efflux system)